MRYVQCPKEFDGKGPSLFLAGGITHCPDWQSEMIDLLWGPLTTTELTLVNPRRENFDISNDNLTKEQIEWEYRHLQRVWSVLFWFPYASLCPITLFELGKMLNTPKTLYVGCHPNYKRRLDLEVQLKLAKPRLQIVYSIQDLADQVVADGHSFL